MALSDVQKQELYEAGFVRLPGIVPPALVEAALRAINSSLGDEGIAPQRLTEFRAQSYCPELRGTPAITDLLTQGVPGRCPWGGPIGRITSSRMGCHCGPT